MNKKKLWVFLAFITVFAISYRAVLIAAEHGGKAAEIRATQEGSLISGKAIFTETENGLKIEVKIAGVPHGDLLKDGFQHAHAGDLGNIEIGPDGKGTLKKVIPGLTLKEGKYGVVGRALILHEKEDNFGQPTGNAGGRIACGVI